MIVINNKINCTGCNVCATSCPVNCVKMKEDDEGFRYPMVDEQKCVNCGICEKVCPLIDLKTDNKSNIPNAYAAINKNDSVRINSSSGGIFSLIAEYVINQGGYVVGAVLSDDNTYVFHNIISKDTEIAGIRGSKYLQSMVDDVYSKVKSILDEGKMVFFTGTPCQIGGLYSYLKKEYINLYTQDLICHGVSSPLIWRKYVEMLNVQKKSSAKQISFRNKKRGWLKFSLDVLFDNGEEYNKSLEDDLFLRGFLSNLYLRPSCYDCKFKTVNRQADITLADFWGIKNVIPEMFDDKGTSLILVNSEKGKKLFDNIKSRIIFKECKIEDALKYNTAAVKSVTSNPQRELFFNRINEENFSIVMKSMNRLTIKQYLIDRVKKVKKIIKKILLKR